MMDKFTPCPFISWCPYMSAVCRACLPDEGCYVYRYFKELISKEKE